MRRSPEQIVEEENTDTVSVDHLFDRVQKIMHRLTFWRTAAICAVAVSGVLVVIVTLLAVTLNDRDQAIARRDCRDAVFAQWGDHVNGVIQSLLVEDPSQLEQAQKELQDLGSLESNYAQCFKPTSNPN